jgi:hypothetical protein
MKRYRSRTEISALILEEGNQRDSVIRIKIRSATSITRALPIRHSQSAILPNINLGSHTVKRSVAMSATTTAHVFVTR